MLVNKARGWICLGQEIITQEEDDSPGLRHAAPRSLRLRRKEGKKIKTETPLYACEERGDERSDVGVSKITVIHYSPKPFTPFMVILQHIKVIGL
ncbi:hypothetical protein [Mucilaginibacter endophyticus]|uniref:hypothetical protein n=1 Tax=Mucilaginibacter endophyticus TaxID=2675003 RepID=UPI000E0D3F83|nr:hypothetical protein [Mucilaginibacter endophyticus]